jgi:hypothetical protein
MVSDDLPTLPSGKDWPVHMLGEGRLKAQMRETYARIARSVAGDRELALEKVAALEWCRANGNPHLEEIPHVA